MKMIHFRWVNTESGDIIVDRMYQVIKSLLTEWYGRPQKDEMVEYIKEKIALSFNDPEFSMHELLLRQDIMIQSIFRVFLKLKPAKSRRGGIIKNSARGASHKEGG